jgi:hypothetical protein
LSSWSPRRLATRACHVRFDGVGRASGLAQRGRDAREQVEAEVARRSIPVLDVVAEDPKIPHVADEVQPVGVQEHRRQDRQSDVLPGKNGAGPVLSPLERASNDGDSGRQCVNSQGTNACSYRNVVSTRLTSFVSSNHGTQLAARTRKRRRDREEEQGHDRRTLRLVEIAQGQHASRPRFASWADLSCRCSPRCAADPRPAPRDRVGPGDSPATSMRRRRDRGGQRGAHSPDSERRSRGWTVASRATRVER